MIAEAVRKLLLDEIYQLEEVKKHPEDAEDYIKFELDSLKTLLQCSYDTICGLEKKISKLEARQFEQRVSEVA